MVSVLDSLKILCSPGDVHELRILDYPLGDKFTHTVSGYYDDLGTMADDAEVYDGNAKGIYLTLNPCLPDCLARSANKSGKAKRDSLTSDKHIRRRRWLPIDFDPLRVSGISSTNQEHDAAIDAARECRAWLAGQGFPEPILADSGNGGHLLYRIDLPNDEASTNAVKSFLEAVAKRFTTDKIGGDVTIFNAARIWKLYGTITRKGSDTHDRPHRRAGILECPETLSVVSLDLMASVSGRAAPGASPARLDPRPAPAPAARPAGDVATFIDRHGLKVESEGTDGKIYRWKLAVCPFDPAHVNSAAVVHYHESRKTAFKCFHDSCRGRKWQHVKELFGEASQRGDTKLSKLIDAASKSGRIFRSPDRIGYVRIGRDVFRLSSTAARRWLAGVGRIGGILASPADVLNTVFQLESIADETPPESVHVRIARDGDTIYHDLGANGTVVITREGWNVEKEVRVNFLRSDNYGELPLPERGGHIDLLQDCINVTREEFPLIRGAILDAFKSRRPYFVTLFHGLEGSAKTTCCLYVRRLFDPLKAGEISMGKPRDEKEFAVLAGSSAMIVLDNVSHIPQWFSDFACSLSTGGGYHCRKLYTDAESVIIDKTLPILINGIPECSESGDLLSRAVKISCPVIGERRNSYSMDAEFNRRLPRILGGIYDALASGLKHDTHTIENAPRMADSCEWVSRCEIGIDRAGQFVKAFRANQRAIGQQIVADSPVANAIESLLTDQKMGRWEGTSSELLAMLSRYAASAVKTFPQTPKTLSDAIRRLEPRMTQCGYSVKRRTLDGRTMLGIEWKRPV